MAGMGSNSSEKKSHLLKFGKQFESHQIAMHSLGLFKRRCYRVLLGHRRKIRVFIFHTILRHIHIPMCSMYSNKY